MHVATQCLVSECRCMMIPSHGRRRRSLCSPCQVARPLTAENRSTPLTTKVWRTVSNTRCDRSFSIRMQRHDDTDTWVPQALPLQPVPGRQPLVLNLEQPCATCVKVWHTVKNAGCCRSFGVGVQRHAHTDSWAPQAPPLQPGPGRPPLICTPPPLSRCLRNLQLD